MGRTVGTTTTRAVARKSNAKAASSGPVLCQVGTRPKDDDVYFEQMIKVIFRSGLNWTMIENKWPNFQKAFARFSIHKVARFNEPEIDRLMKDKGIVRNYRKVIAAVKNAGEFAAIQKEHGSFKNYLQTISQGGENALCKTLSKRFSFLGGSTAVFFLRCVGEEMPETIRQWTKEHELQTR